MLRGPPNADRSGLDFADADLQDVGLTPVSFLLLPGLDGSGALFEDFVRAAPSSHSINVMRYPRTNLSFDALAADAVRQLPPRSRSILLAESFGGPIALRIATLAPDRVLGVILCNSFVSAPVRSAKFIPFALLPSRPPSRAVRRWLAGDEAPDDLVERARTVIGWLPRAVIAARVRMLSRLDDRTRLASIAAPLAYVRGTEDRLVDDSAMTEVQRIRPDAEVFRLAAPHFILQRSPAEAWNALGPLVERWSR
jgi:pimeloyl-[acyl-carrier protein] methyl ester esterase